MSLRRRLSTLISEHALESVGGNETCGTSSVDACSASPSIQLMHDTQESFNNNNPEIEKVEYGPITIAEHIRTRPKGRLIDLHPVEVTEIMEWKKAKKEELEKLLQPTTKDQSHT